MNTAELRKIQIVMNSYKSEFNIPIPCDKVKGIKVRWLYYETADFGLNFLYLSFDKLGASGYVLAPNGHDDAYFYSTPLDPNKSVTCLSSDFNGAYDISYPKAVESINQFTITASINGLPAIQYITQDNPIVLELGFYS